jgi:L-threonylcarbamoyladenylate synthase
MNDSPSLIQIEQAVSLLARGSVGVIPTDTVYGLAARAHDPLAVTKLYALKDRNHKPGTIIASSVQQLLDLSVVPDSLNQVQHLWPNPLSIILPLDHEYLHQGLGDIAIRVVSDEKTKALLDQTGPLLTSSANKPGEPGSTTVKEAWNYFYDTVDFYVDGGDLSAQLPSTIIRSHNNGRLEILRQGAFVIPDAYTSGIN